MTIQTNANVQVVVRRETTTGTIATATGAHQVRIIGSPGMELKRAPIVAQELRNDGVTNMGRLGGKTVDGSLDMEVTVGGAVDVLLEALMRSTWVTSYAIGFATMTTIAIGTNTLTAAGGDFVGTQGVRVGDIFTLSSTTVSGNNSLRSPVIAVGSMTITTVTGAFTTLAATATGTMTILKKVKTPTTPTRYSHSIEQYDEDTDLSEVFLGCRVVGMKLSCKPNEMAKMSFTFKGMDRTAYTTGTSPYFTSPSITTGIGLIADDATIVYNGSKVTSFTGIDLDFTLGADVQAVLGTFTSPDVFDNVLSVSGSITGLVSDFSNITLYDAETEFEIHLLLQEQMAVPKNCLAFYFPRVKISGRSAPVGGQTGPKVETLSLMIGPKVAATGYDAGVCTISSSAA